MGGFALEIFKLLKNTRLYKNYLEHFKSIVGLSLIHIYQISLLMPRMLIILMVMKLRHIVIYHLNYQIAYHSGMVVLSFQVIRSLMMCTLINQFQKTINLFWELTI